MKKKRYRFKKVLNKMRQKTLSKQALNYFDI